MNILDWWKFHENVFPLLSKLAKKVFTVTASSAKSGRVFSTGGNFETAKKSALKRVFSTGGNFETAKKECDGCSKKLKIS